MADQGKSARYPEMKELKKGFHSTKGTKISR